MRQEKPPEEAPLSILFVEDNPVTSASLTKAFERRGYSVTHTMNLEQSLKAIEESDHFDYLLCDYDLNGENGLIAAKAFADKFSDSAFAMFTGYEDFLRRKEVQEFLGKSSFARHLDVLYKPIDRNLIFQWLVESRQDK